MDAQVDKIMAARKKDCPLAAKWAPIKGKHKVLANRGIFKGDLDGPLKAYDDAVQAYADALQGKKELVVVLLGMFAGIQKIRGELDKLRADRDKSEEDAATGRDWTAMEKFAKQADADPAEVTKTLDSFASTFEKSAKLHKQVSDQLVAVGMTQLDVILKGRDEYKSKAEKLEATLQKAYDGAYKAQENIRAVLSDFISTAEEIENAELQKQLQGLYKFASS